MDETVIVVTGSEPLDAILVAALPPNHIVIAADGALDHSLAAGLTPAGLVGDLDSISPEGLAWAREHATIQQHDPDKDHTDTELALAMAVDLNPARLILVSGGGDRLDHTFAAIGALGHPNLTSVPVVEGWWGTQHVRVLHGPGRLRFDEPVGTTISLIALHGQCKGVTVSGVRWPLTDGRLSPVAGLGVSNIVTGDVIEIVVLEGVVTVITTPAGTNPADEPA